LSNVFFDNWQRHGSWVPAETPYGVVALLAKMSHQGNLPVCSTSKSLPATTLE
jgi:hypothetical protein